MDTILHLYAFCAAAVFIYVTCGFWLSRHLGQRDDLADVTWGLGFVVIAFVSLAISVHNQLVGFPTALLTVLVFVWGVRLSWHIGRRFIRSTGDRRYLEVRQKWTNHIQLRSYLMFFVMQGVLMLVIALPVVIVNAHAFSFHGYQLIGLALWLVGFYFESIGDAQLGRFVRNPANKGKLMTTGLWRYSRHPNYFGELTEWWGIALIALGAPFGWLGVIGPLTLSLLILKVSGIPTAEARIKTRPAWPAYAASTSVLIPLPPQSVCQSFWWRLSALAGLSGLLYCSWPLGYVLNPVVAQRGLASGFEGLHQPYNWLFIGGDVTSSVLIVVVCWLLWRKLHGTKLRTRGRQKRLLIAILWSVVIFAIGTSASALLPEHCEPSVQRCPDFRHDHLLLVHGILSIIASLFLFFSLALLWWQRRSDHLLNGLLAGYILFGLFALASLFSTNAGNWSQQYYITLCSLWLALVPYAIYKLYVLASKPQPHKQPRKYKSTPNQSANRAAGKFLPRLYR
jgi:steroid 5-alpha reductase family enzyme